MYRFAATLASKARVVKSRAQQSCNVLIEQSYAASNVKNVGASPAKQVANATNGIAGDVLTRGILSQGSKPVGMNTMGQRCGTGMISTFGDIAQVGGASEAEEREKKDKFSYALNATKAAGLLPGGGVGLLYAPKNLTAVHFHQNIGVGITQDALRMPIRTFASNNAGVEGEAKLTSSLRPLSPHLNIYTPQPSSTSSIFHRITGIFLSTMILSFYLITMKMGSICLTFENFYQFLFYSSKLTLLSVEVSALALAYHLFNGIRHLRMDYGGFPFFGRKSSGALKAFAKKGH